MIAALIDNGSLEPAAHLNLRSVAARLSARSGVTVHAVSWKHSDRIPAQLLGGEPAATLRTWVRQQFAGAERDFLFIPFFISPQGAIGSSLRRDLELLRTEFPTLTYSFTRGIARPGAVAELAAIVVDRVRATLAATGLHRPPVIVVDHGGPSAESAVIRDEVADAVRTLLGNEVAQVAAASMEGAEHAHNRPLFAELLAGAEFGRSDVVVAPLFLSPGRHAGPRGDLAVIALSAAGADSSLRCHFTELVGTHPGMIGPLVAQLEEIFAGISARTETHALRAPASPLPFALGKSLFPAPSPNFA